MKCVQKVTYAVQQRCRRFVHADSSQTNRVQCHSHQELIAVAQEGVVNTVKCLGHVNKTRMNRGSRVECTIPIIHDGKELPDRRPLWEKTELFIWDSMYFQTMRLELIFDETFEDLRDTR